MGKPDSVAAPVRVLVVDDQRPFHDAAREVISATPGFEWIGSASSGEEGVDEANRLRPDLVLMDVRMPGIGGIEAARQMTSGEQLAVVVLITAGEPPSGIPDGTAAEIVFKYALSRKLLRRLWDDHGSRQGARSLTPRLSSPPAADLTAVSRELGD
jgi:CheY-like chemotaxis protein